MAENIKISKRYVDAVKPKGVRFTVWDTEIPGFGLRVGINGSKTYVFRYRVGGGRSGRIRLATLGQHGTLTPDQARELAQRYALEAAAGKDPAGDKIERRKAPTVADLMAQYLTEHVEVRNKPRTVQGVADLVNRVILKDPLAARKVADVTGADVARFQSRHNATPTQANRARSALSKAFALAEVWGYRPRKSNPCAEVPAFKETARERFLAPAEFAALGDVLAKAQAGELAITEDGTERLARVNPWAIAAIRLLIFTAARCGEILTLRWEWIDWQAGRANLPDSKTGRKPLMLPPPALEVLRDVAQRVGIDRPERAKGFVIRGGDYTDPERHLVNIKDPWAIIRQAAGLPELRIHDLRHSFASVMVAGGASLSVIGALLGHRDVKTTARYAHLATDPLRAAADHAGGLLEAQLKGPKGGAKVVPIQRKR